jgi:3-phenylpropionate/trans-cinnamate dioxygenase ferredoxin subunit
MSEGTQVDLCGTDELGIGERRRFVLAGGPICLVRLRDRFAAVADTCSHEDFPLSEGEVELDDCLIECWKHGSMFSLLTGEPESFPATQPVAVYPVSVENDRVCVRIP